MKPKHSRNTSIHTRNVPADTKAQFKAFCARRGYTMEAAIIALLRKAAREDRTLPDARKRK
jgi:plasmid stability protein